MEWDLQRHIGVRECDAFGNYKQHSAAEARLPVARSSKRYRQRLGGIRSPGVFSLSLGFILKGPRESFESLLTKGVIE